MEPPWRLPVSSSPAAPRARHSRRLRPALALLLAALLPPFALTPARAVESAVERVARSGELVMVGAPGMPPMLSFDAAGQASGYAVVVGRRIAAELANAIGRPVRLRVEAEADPVELSQRIVTGRASLACGVPFTWERDMTLDYSLPIGLSGLRLLAPAGRLDGSAASLAGRRIGVVRDSLADTELLGFQPKALPQRFASLREGVAALEARRIDGMVGDSTLLAGLVHRRPGGPWALTPEVPYERYAVSCLLPENDSSFRNLANLAIARLLSEYLDGVPATVAEVNAWVGPGSPLNLPPERIRSYFESVLLGVETLRPLPAGPAPGAAATAP